MSEVIQKAAECFRKMSKAFSKVADLIEVEGRLPFEQRDIKRLEAAVSKIEEAPNPMEDLDAMGKEFEAEFPQPVKEEDISLL